MRKATVAVALLVSGGFGLAGLVRAADTPTTPGTPASGIKQDDIPEVQHLRETRRHLNEAKDAFEKDPKDKDNHRQEILDGIDKSIKAVDDEINELKGSTVGTNK